MEIKISSLITYFLYVLWFYVERLSLAGVVDSEVVFLVENNEIFDKCEGETGNGIHDLVDMSNIKIQIDDYSMHAEGSAELVWDVEPTDRVAFRLEILKYQRGNWQPTVYNVIKSNFCPAMFSTEEIWYDSFTSKIQEKAVCVNSKGSVYNLEPVDQYLSFKTTKNSDLEGRHKLVLRFEAFDENDVKRPNTVCAEIRGEFEKLK